MKLIFNEIISKCISHSRLTRWLIKHLIIPFYGCFFCSHSVRIAVTLISAVFPLFALLPLLSFSVSLSYSLLSMLMVISNLICIQITSPGGTPIRGKNAGYRKPLLITLSSSPPSPLSSSSCHLSMSHFQLSVHLLCRHHILQSAYGLGRDEDNTVEKGHTF